jgi:glycosyltransferase involved in cell wall biosynthesis
MISSLGVQSNVQLMGLGVASKVLQRGWLFLNSSKSEGMPLALGEAGLAGLLVVCTDVGGSREVHVDRSSFLSGC